MTSAREQRSKPFRRAAAQLLLAALLTLPIWIAGHVLAFGLANVGWLVGDRNAGNCAYTAGEGLMVSLWLGLMLVQTRGSRRVRMAVWAPIAVLTVIVVPAVSIYVYDSEIGIGTLVWLQLAAAFFALLAWLPLWQPPWIVPRQRDPDLCIECNYDLRGTPSRLCPECGTANELPSDIQQGHAAHAAE